MVTRRPMNAPVKQSVRVAYLVNHYPKVSHSFIRREILALERQGVDVLRIAVRGANDSLVDPEDQREQERTRYVLKGGLLGLMLATVAVAVRRPLMFAKSLRLALGMSRRSD